MNFLELFIVAMCLSMDAFAVSVCKGLSAGRINRSHALLCGAYFGGFQALMPLIGWAVGVRFLVYIEHIDHWIAFVLLGALGAKMIWESCQKEEGIEASFAPREMLPLAVATSIDALAVGVTFALLEVDIVSAVLCIGVTTLVLSALGVWIGAVFGGRWKSRAELGGGVILIILGSHILVEHLGLFR